MKRFPATLVALALVAGSVSSRAEHESVPAWPPLINALPVAVAGTGPTFCGAQTVQALPASLAVDLQTQVMSGTVAGDSGVTCVAQVPVRVSLIVAVYRQSGSGRLDPATLLAAEPAHLTLVTKNTCVSTLSGIATWGCATPRATFTNPPGSRIVVVSGATYELQDPRGGAWIVVTPPACREQETRAKAYCFVAADFRS